MTENFEISSHNWQEDSYFRKRVYFQTVYITSDVNTVHMADERQKEHLLW